LFRSAHRGGSHRQILRELSAHMGSRSRVRPTALLPGCALKLRAPDVPV